MSGDVAKAVERLRRLLVKDAANRTILDAEQWSDETLRRVRPVVTTRAIEKARKHLDEVLLAATP